MALSLLSVRRVLSLSASLTKHQRPFSAFPAISSSPYLSSAAANPQNPSSDLIQPHHHQHHHLQFQSRNFRSSSVWLDRVRPSFRNNNNNNDDEIGPDTILFEGCDYNHWLITMDFPKDPAPTREEMIETYLQTLAKVVGSYEEAKKRMYAFSTTTYVGFNCLVTEEMSEKFKTLPGVVFVLPDSYIDPVNKEYGGDKYENGVITPRPPPQQYGRSGGRYGDRNRDQNRPRHQQGNPTYGNQGPMYGDTRNVGQQNNSPMQPSYSPMGTGGDRRNPMPMSNAQATYNQNEQQNNSPMQPSYSPMGTGGDRRNPMPMNNAQAAYNQNEQGYYNPLGGRIAPEQRNYMPPGQNDIRGDNRNYVPPQSVPYGQGAGGNYDQGARGNYGQGAGGNQGQGFGAGHNRETGFGYGQSYAGPGEGPRFSQVEQRDNMQGEQKNYAPMTHTDRVRY